MITHLLVNGRYARVIDVGPANAPVLLMLHGFAGNASAWEDIAKGLVPEYRVLAADLPGHGAESDARGSDCTMQAATTRLARILSRLAVERVTLVGYSMGGRLALHFALSHSQLVERLCLVGASAGIADETERRERRDADDKLAAYLQVGGIKNFTESWQANPLFENLERNNPRAHKAIRQMRLSCSADGLAASLRGMGAGSQAYLGDHLREIAVPVQLITGELDSKFTAIAQQMHAAFTTAPHDPSRVSLTTIADAGHAVHAEKPQQFIDTLRAFLAAHITSTNNTTDAVRAAHART